MKVWRHKISYCSLAKSSLSLSSYGDGVCFTWSNLHRSHCQSGQLLWSVNKDRIVWVCLAVNLGFDANLEQRGLAPCSQEGKGVRKKIRSPEFLLFPSYHKTTQWNGLWKTYGGFGRFMHTNLIVWNCISEPSKWFKVKSPVSTKKIMSSWQSVTWQGNFPKTSLENCRSFPVLHTSLLWGGKSQESKQMLLLLGKASLKGTVHTQKARVISAVRLCTKVALVMNGGFMFRF